MRDWRVHSQPIVPRTIEGRLGSIRRSRRGYVPRPVYWVALALLGVAALIKRYICT